MTPLDPNPAPTQALAWRGQRLQIEYVDPATLVPDPNNPRFMPSGRLTKLERSLTELGFVEPVVARAEDRLVIGGHQRLAIAVARRWPTVPVVFLRGLSDREKDALNLALNNDTYAGGVFEIGKLVEILSELDGAGIDVTVTGIGEEKLERLLTWTPALDDHDADVPMPGEPDPSPSGEAHEATDVLLPAQIRIGLIWMQVDRAAYVAWREGVVMDAGEDTLDAVGREIVRRLGLDDDAIVSTRSASSYTFG